MTKMIDAHWANVPMTRIPLSALACTCVSLPLLATASWITVQADDPASVSPWVFAMALVALGFFAAFMVICARASHASGSRPRAKYGRCVVLADGETHGPFPDEDAANEWATRQFDSDTSWTVHPLSDA